jgi:hypothetical protein
MAEHEAGIGKAFPALPGPKAMLRVKSGAAYPGFFGRGVAACEETTGHSDSSFRIVSYKSARGKRIPRGQYRLAYYGCLPM